MTEHERELAADCYGYGRWEAPYWFIGPEQGQGGWEKGELTARYQAFVELSKNGLCDCAQFHRYIGEDRWQSKLQSTWRRLILLLLAYKRLSVADSDLLDYQRSEWGSAGGETCIIELSGLPATSFNVPRDRKSFRESRMANIVQKALITEPKFIVV